MSEPRLLALDLGKRTGVCRMRRHQTPMFSTINLEKYPTLHERLGRFGDWLVGTQRTTPIDGIAWEGPLLMPWDKIDQLLLTYGLVAITRNFAWREGLPWCEVAVPDVKHAMLGASRAPKDTTKTHGQRRTEAKLAMIAAAYKLGWHEVIDDHQADAGGVGLCAYSTLWPKEPGHATTALRDRA